MKNTEKNYHKNSVIIDANGNLIDNVNIAVKDGKTLAQAIEEVNNGEKMKAFNQFFDGKVYNWALLTYGIYYANVNDDNTEVVTKKLSVNDCCILKANKKSYKALIPTKILTPVKVFGVNVADAKRLNIGIDDGTITKLAVNAKYNITEECFTCDTCTSINQLEKQMQYICNTMYGNDFVKIKKSYVRHLVEQFTKAINDGYRNGNEIALMQLIVNHTYDAIINKVYDNKSSLEMHRKPKENA